MVHQGFCSDSHTIAQYGKEGSEVGLDGEVGESILGVEGEIHKRTSVSNTRFRQKNKDGSRCIRLCNRRSTIYGM